MNPEPADSALVAGPDPDRPASARRSKGPTGGTRRDPCRTLVFRSTLLAEKGPRARVELPVSARRGWHAFPGGCVRHAAPCDCLVTGSQHGAAPTDSLRWGLKATVPDLDMVGDYRVDTLARSRARTACSAVSRVHALAGHAAPERGVLLVWRGSGAELQRRGPQPRLAGQGGVAGVPGGAELVTEVPAVLQEQPSRPYASPVDADVIALVAVEVGAHLVGHLQGLEAGMPAPDPGARAPTP